MGCVSPSNSAAVEEEPGASNKEDVKQSIVKQVSSDFATSDDENTAAMFDLSQQYDDDLQQQVALLDQVYGVDVKARKKKKDKDGKSFDYFADPDEKNDHNSDFDVEFVRNSSNSDATKGTVYMIQQIAYFVCLFFFPFFSFF